MKTEIIVALIAFIPGIYASVMVHMKTRLERKHLSAEYIKEQIATIKTVLQKFEPFEKGISIYDTNNIPKSVNIILNKYDNAKKIFSNNSYLINPNSREKLKKLMENIDNKYFALKKGGYEGGEDKQKILTDSLINNIKQKDDWVNNLKESFEIELIIYSDKIRFLIN